MTITKYKTEKKKDSHNSGVYFPVPRKREDMSLDEKIEIIDKRVKEINRFMGWINNEQLNHIQVKLTLIILLLIAMLVLLMVRGS